MRSCVALVGVIVLTQFVYGQGPGNPYGFNRKPQFSVPGQLPPSMLMPKRVTPNGQQKTVAIAPKTVRFDPRLIRLSHMQNRWVLFAGNVQLRDFAGDERTAQEAFRLIQRLHLNEHGQIGSPQPIMEYWLTNGAAPVSLSTTGLKTKPVDPERIRAERFLQQWVVRDDHHILFNFGTQEADARAAVRIIRRYRFKRIGYVGYPQPNMIYFLGEQDNRANGKSNKTVPTQPIQQTKSTITKEQQSIAAIMAVQHLAKGYGQLSAPMTQESMRFRFEPRQTKLLHRNGSWQLCFQNETIADFGKDYYQAQQLQSWLQQYGCNELHRVGFPNPVLTYFLINGVPARGAKLSMSGQKLHLRLLELRQIEGQWNLCQQNRVLLPLGNHRGHAEQALQVIRRYGFDYMAMPVGLSSQCAVPFLLRSR